MTFDSRSIVPVFFLFPLGGALRSSQGSGRAGGWGGLCFSSLASLCCLQPDLTGIPLHLRTCVHVLFCVPAATRAPAPTTSYYYMLRLLAGFHADLCGPLKGACPTSCEKLREVTRSFRDERLSS